MTAAEQTQRRRSIMRRRLIVVISLEADLGSLAIVLLSCQRGGRREENRQRKRLAAGCLASLQTQLSLSGRSLRSPSRPHFFGRLGVPARRHDGRCYSDQS